MYRFPIPHSRIEIRCIKEDRPDAEIAEQGDIAVETGMQIELFYLIRKACFPTQIMAEPHDLYPAHHRIVPFAGILDTRLNDRETHRPRNLMFRIEMLEVQFFRFFVQSVSYDDLTAAIP